MKEAHPYLEKDKSNRGVKEATDAVCIIASTVREWLIDNGYDNDIETVMQMTDMVLRAKKELGKK